MAKKNKGKTKATPSAALTPASVMDPENDDLMSDLLAQLDSRDETVKVEDENLNQTHRDKQSEMLEVQPRQSAKSRFQARLVSHILPSAHYRLIRLKSQGQESSSPGT
jgi:OTU domain-containing protein 6